MAGIVILSDHAAGKLMLKAALAAGADVTTVEDCAAECCVAARVQYVYECNSTHYDIPHWQKLHDRYQRRVYMK